MAERPTARSTGAKATVAKMTESRLTGAVSTQERPTIALMLQGGGALGAYHIGAYQALAEAGLAPDWIAGISIGAVNAAVIAGNEPHHRVERLNALWEAISWPDPLAPLAKTPLSTWHAVLSGAEAILFGQPDFFTPRVVNPYLLPKAPPQDLSFYDLSPLSATLQQFADFGLINRGATRLSLGATNLLTGELEFFDTHHRAIGPEHVLASASLPPGFPATLADGKLYWDGACVSNTPLDAVIDASTHSRMVVFLIDLWDPAGVPPRNMFDVQWRIKQIQYASRNAYHIKAAATRVNLRHAMRLLHPSAEAAAAPHCTRLDIVHVMYRPNPDPIPNSDAEFSRTSIAERREAGRRDMRAALRAAPWVTHDLPTHLAAAVHCVACEKVTTIPASDLLASTARSPAAP